VNRWYFLLLAGLIIFDSISLTGQAESVRSKVSKGIESYQNGDYTAAEQLFLDAHVSSPDLAEPAFNLGISQYKQQRHDDSLKSFGSVGSTSREHLKADNHFNMGNAHYQIGETNQDKSAYQNAIDNYKHALRLDPGFLDAKYNLEMALRKLEQMEEKKQEQDSPQEQKKNEDQENQEQEQQPDQGTPDEQNSSEQNQDQSDSDSSQESGERSQQAPQSREMTPEEAERLLQMVQNEEADLKDVMNRLYGSPPNRVPKDW